MTSFIEKPWGSEELLEKNEFYVVKKLTMNAGHQCSLQYHNEKHETVYVLEGELHLFFEDKWRICSPGDVVVIPPKAVHRMPSSSRARGIETPVGSHRPLLALASHWSVTRGR